MYDSHVHVGHMITSATIDSKALPPRTASPECNAYEVSHPRTHRHRDPGQSHQHHRWMQPDHGRSYVFPLERSKLFPGAAWFSCQHNWQDFRSIDNVWNLKEKKRDRIVLLLELSKYGPALSFDVDALLSGFLKSLHASEPAMDMKLPPCSTLPHSECSCSICHMMPYTIFCKC